MLKRLRSLLGGQSAAAAPTRRVGPLASYDQSLKAELQTLPQRTQAVFAAACALVEQCVGLIPDGEAEGSIPAHADDAIASAAYALEAASGLDPMAAGWAAERVTDTLDSFVLSNEIDDSLPDAEQLAWEHPLIRVEISRREADLHRLNNASDWAVAVDAVRANATGVSALPVERLDHRA